MYGLKASFPILKEKIKFSQLKPSRSDQDEPSLLVEQTDIAKP